MLYIAAIESARLTISTTGLIQVNLAVAAGTFLEPIQFSNNDTSHLAKVHVLSITNSNSFPMLYSLTSVAGQGRGLYDTVSFLTLTEFE
mgnify:FL=1